MGCAGQADQVAGGLMVTLSVQLAASVSWMTFGSLLMRNGPNVCAEP